MSTVSAIIKEIRAEYSSLYHLFAALFLKPDQEILILMPLTLYCDASGKKQEGLNVVAGFLSTVDQWLLFEKEWAAVLKEFNVNYFHMREFAHSVDQFAGWKNDEGKRRRFLTSLVQVIISKTKYWVGSCIILKDYDRVDTDFKLHEHFHPYPLNGRTCIDMILKWQYVHNEVNTPIKYVFEDGDEHFAQLSDRIKERAGIRPIPETRLQASPLQAADFVAYEVFKAYRTFAIELDHLFEKFRESFNLLSAVPHKYGQLEEMALRTICRQEQLARRH